MSATSPRPDRPGCNPAGGLTLIEVLAILAGILFLTAMVLPALLKAKAMAQRLHCVNNQKRVGLGLRIFAVDNTNGLPWQIPTNQGGTKEWVLDDGQMWRHWAAISNELSTPRIALCPADSERPSRGPLFAAAPTLDWSHTTNTSHISYFLGTNGRDGEPESLMGGDRNLSVGGMPVKSGRLVVRTNSVLGFTGAIHDFAGNFLQGDGSVTQGTSSTFDKVVRDSLMGSGPSTNLWLVP